MLQGDRRTIFSWQYQAMHVRASRGKNIITAKPYIQLTLYSAVSHANLLLHLYICDLEIIWQFSALEVVTRMRYINPHSTLTLQVFNASKEQQIIYSISTSSNYYKQIVRKHRMLAFQLLIWGRFVVYQCMVKCGMVTETIGVLCYTVTNPLRTLLTFQIM